MLSSAIKLSICHLLASRMVLRGVVILSTHLRQAHLSGLPRPYLAPRPKASTPPQAISCRLPWTTGHESRITSLPAVAGIAPCLHSTSFFSVVSGLLLHNGRPQPLCFQSLADSSHRHGGVYPPFTISIKRLSPPQLFAGGGGIEIDCVNWEERWRE
jgi:hypothetical protein